MTLTPVGSALIEYCRDDWLPLVGVVDVVEAVAVSGWDGSQPDDAACERAVEAVASLIAVGAVELGTVVEGKGFAAWPEESDGALRRFRRAIESPDWEWAVWLNLTDLGEAMDTKLPDSFIPGSHYLRIVSEPTPEPRP
jgi:hypothetical protein